MNVCEKIYKIGAGSKIYGTEKGVCRITGKEGVGINFAKWVRDTFNDHDRQRTNLSRNPKTKDMKAAIRRAYNILTSGTLYPVLQAELRKPPFPHPNERAAEYAFALRYLKTFGSGPVLDIGPGRSSWPHLLTICGFTVRAIDSKEGYWKGYTNRHFLVEKDDIRKPRITGPFQFITCISTLEHIPETSQAIKGMSALLAPGGYLVLTFPYNEKHYGIAQSEKLTQVFSRRELDRWLTDNPELKIVKQEYYRLFEGQTWLQGRSLKHPIRTYRTQPHHLSCLLIRKTHR